MSMSVTPGSCLDPHEVLALIGGGTGEVQRTPNEQRLRIARSLGQVSAGW